MFSVLTNKTGQMFSVLTNKTGPMFSVLTNKTGPMFSVLTNKTGPMFSVLKIDLFYNSMHITLHYEGYIPIKWKIFCFVSPLYVLNHDLIF